MNRRGQTNTLSFENKPAVHFNPAWTVQLRKAGLFSQHISGYVCILPVATPVHQQLENPRKYTWSDSVCNFSSGLGVLNEDQLLKSASFGGIWLCLRLQRGPLSSRFYIKPQRLQTFCISHKTIQQASGETCLTSQTVPFMQIYQYIFPTDCLVMKRDLPKVAQGFKTLATPAQVWKQIQGFAIAFEHSRDLLQQVRSQGPHCSQDLNQTTCEMATTFYFFILFYF